MPGSFFLVIAFGVALLAFAAWWGAKQLQRLEEAYAAKLAERRLTPTDTPLGLPDNVLRTFDLLPRGDRDSSAVWGATGPLPLRIAGTDLLTEACGFEWWWEDRQTSTDGQGHTRTEWVRRAVIAALVEVPDTDLPWVRLESEGLFARLGLGGRSDFQVESEEFNRAFDVRTDSPELAIRLLDAGFQERMLRGFRNTAFELRGRHALVVRDAGEVGVRITGTARRGGAGGIAGMFTRVGDRVSTDPGVIDAVASVRDHARVLLGTMPDSFWRAVRRSEAP